MQKFVPMIDAIICVANPTEMSPKKIRKAIQELFGVDLESQKKQLNALILERFSDIQESPRIIIKREELESKEAKIEKLSKYKEELDTLEKKYLKLKEKAAQQQQQQQQQQGKRKQEQPSRVLRRPKKVTPKKSGSKTKRRDTALTSFLYVLSPQLREFLGSDENLARTTVVKQVWDYIKENNLQNPLDRREIFCDEKMEPVFGKKTTIFGLNKLLSKHLFNPSELVSSDESSGEQEVEDPKEMSDADDEDKYNSTGGTDDEQDMHDYASRKKLKIKTES